VKQDLSRGVAQCGAPAVSKKSLNLKVAFNEALQAGKDNKQEKTTLRILDLGILL
jgi:hypothetical protein